MKDICEQMFEKQIYDEFKGISRSLIIPTRQIKMAALRNSGLKELSVDTRSTLFQFASELLKLCETYGSHYNIKGGIKEQYTALLEFCTKKDEEYGYSKSCKNGLEQLISDVRYVLKVIDSNINFIQNVYKLSDSKDERWNKATVKSAMISSHQIDNYYSDDYDPELAWKVIDDIEVKLKKDKIDLYSPEYGKIILKKLRSYKADIISASNKYFGKNSPFSELKVSELITM